MRLALLPFPVVIPSPLSLPQALSSSHPFTPLSELIKRPLNLNRSILTVNLLAKPVTPPHGEDTPSAMDASQSAVSVGSRSKSRNAPANKEGKGWALIHVCSHITLYNEGQNVDIDQSMTRVVMSRLHRHGN